MGQINENEPLITVKDLPNVRVVGYSFENKLRIVFSTHCGIPLYGFKVKRRETPFEKAIREEAEREDILKRTEDFSKILNEAGVKFCDKCSGRGFGFSSITGTERKDAKIYVKKIICATCNGRGVKQQR